MDNRKVKIRNTRQFGRGVFAERKIKKGEVIAAFDGPFLDDDFEGWTEDLMNHAIQYAKAAWRDSTGIARLINHSCEPNCGIKNYFQVVAMRDILPGEHITWDYEMTEKNSWWKMKCRCGNASCRKIIGNYSRMPLAVRNKYRGFISEWLLGKPFRARRPRQA
ncbi:MAG: SET domain-containing protein [Bdellovibrionales bacterium]